MKTFFSGIKTRRDTVRRTCRCLLLASAIGGWNHPSAARGDVSATTIPLGEWGSGETVELKQFAGTIVVLDFFAFWCVPCLKTSTAVERELRAFYEANGGNGNGVPVTVLTVNIESEFPERTDRFIARAGAHHVLFDRDGTLLNALGGAGLPFLAILKPATEQGDPSVAPFAVAYAEPGFPGIPRLREVIDAIQPTSSQSNHSSLDGPPPDRESNPVPPSDTPLPPILNAGAHRIEADFEYLTASDVRLTQGAVAYGLRTANRDLSVAVSHNRMEVDFVSPDFLTQPASVTEGQTAVQGAWQQALGARSRLQLSGGYYEGFTDFRSAWLHEYYGQRYAAVGYDMADPSGHNVTAGFRFEYVPGSGFLQVDLGRFTDRIAPSAEFVLDPTTFRSRLIQGSEHLTTTMVSFSSENVLSKRVRSLVELRFSETSERRLRTSIQGSVHAALGEYWIWRATVGGTQERPQFEAGFASMGLEVAVRPEIHLRAAARVYSDTGEIQNSIPLSSAPPGLTSYHFGLGVRYVRERFGFNLFGGPVIAGYDDMDSGTRFFDPLYSDRDWWLIQAALSAGF